MASGLLLPGFRFQPSDADIIRNYLMYKILGRPQPHDPIVTVDDAYSLSPEQLPLNNNDGRFIDNEWYFYTTRPIRRRYVTRNGYYFATSSMDEQIFHNNKVVGFKRILKFYLGTTAETGIETEWFVHEYRVNTVVFRADMGSSLVMCKIIRTPEPSDNSSEKGVKDAHNSSRTNMDGLQGKQLFLQSSL